MFGQATKRIHLWIATALRCARGRGRAAARGARTRGRCSSPTRPLDPLAASPRSGTATRQVTGAALGPPSLLSFPPLTPPFGPSSRHPLPSPAPMWRPGRGRQGRPRQPPPLAGLALAPPARFEPPASRPRDGGGRRGPASADGSGARRIYRSLRAPR
ncbi:splicing factor 3B subunit 4-like [Motacilla alba alba]|uniref:splicing factor 3B subunit 4-like n=1 Tax=Motacilla alba alba TaxID=1094192 RepID=UPI0018D55E88|nr:splicing factor 3B subunit 4-like [Motacilla alba alba]